MKIYKLDPQTLLQVCTNPPAQANCRRMELGTTTLVHVMPAFHPPLISHNCHICHVAIALLGVDICRKSITVQWQKLSNDSCSVKHLPHATASHLGSESVLGAMFLLNVCFLPEKCLASSATALGRPGLM